MLLGPVGKKTAGNSGKMSTCFAFEPGVSTIG